MMDIKLIRIHLLRNTMMVSDKLNLFMKNQINIHQAPLQKIRHCLKYKDLVAKLPLVLAIQTNRILHKSIDSQHH